MIDTAGIRAWEGRGQAVLGDSHLTRVAAAGLLCLAAVSCGAELPSSCRCLRKDNKYVLFGRNSFSGDTSPVTANGAPVTAFHAAVPGGVFEVSDGKIARACRDRNSELDDDDVLSGI